MGTSLYGEIWATELCTVGGWGRVETGGLYPVLLTPRMCFWLQSERQKTQAPKSR